MPKTRPLSLEQYILDDLDAKPHANSGAMFKKHDGSTEDHVIEVKTTQRKSFAINREYWDGLDKQSMQRFREPVMVLVFDDEYSYSDTTKLVIINYEYFKELLENTEE